MARRRPGAGAGALGREGSMWKALQAGSCCCLSGSGDGLRGEDEVEESKENVRSLLTEMEKRPPGKTEKDS